jgi:hypothetical protein
MATVQQQILESFFEKLSKLGTLEQTTLTELRTALQSGKKLKADDFVALLTKNPKDGAA